MGESSPLVNVIWGLVNFLIGFVLLYGMGDFCLGLNRGLMMAGLGALATSVALAWYFQRVRRG